MFLNAFWACSAIHLVSLMTGPTWLEWVTKALLMPLLAAWVISRRGPRLVVAALGFSWLGDVLLQFDGLFIAGMGAFALAHVCYVTYFAGRPRIAAVVGYAVAWAVLMALLLPSLGALQIPIALYSLLLTATAVMSTRHSLTAAIGGGLFLLSDTLIAVRLAGIDLPLGGVLVMSTYIAAQYLLASSTSRREHTPAYGTAAAG